MLFNSQNYIPIIRNTLKIVNALKSLKVLKALQIQNLVMYATKLSIYYSSKFPL